jgi:uncharacterized membrane protein YhaH (DUF805 family)
MRWYLQVLRKYAVFSGRARREEYWTFLLVHMLIYFGMSFFDVFVGQPDGWGDDPWVTLYALAVLPPGIAVQVRRMHDSDHRGWWLLVPVLNFVFLLRDGTHGSNRFGPDPKAAASERLFD